MYIATYAAVMRTTAPAIITASTVSHARTDADASVLLSIDARGWMAYPSSMNAFLYRDMSVHVITICAAW